jgi:hypothetical protein
MPKIIAASVVAVALIVFFVMGSGPGDECIKIATNYIENSYAGEIEEIIDDIDMAGDYSKQQAQMQKIIEHGKKKNPDSKILLILKKSDFDDVQSLSNEDFVKNALRLVYSIRKIKPDAFQMSAEVEYLAYEKVGENSVELKFRTKVTTKEGLEERNESLVLIERDGQWYVRFIDVGFWQLVLKIVNKVKEV